MSDDASALQREIRQTRPFGSRTQEATLGILRTADLLRRMLARIIEPHGITVQQYNVLRILRGAGEEPMPTLEIAERMIEQAPGITRLLDRLEAKELVSRQRCTEDRRLVHCRITPAGLDLLATMEEDVLRGDEAVLSAVPSQEVEHLIRLLDAVRAGMQER